MAEGHIGNLGALRYPDLTALMRVAAAQEAERLAAVRRDLTATPERLSDRDRSLIACMLRRLADDAIDAVAVGLRAAPEPAAIGLAERLCGSERPRVHAALGVAGALHGDGPLAAALIRLAEWRIDGGPRAARRDEYAVLRSRRLDEYGNPRVPLAELSREDAETLLWSCAAGIRIALPDAEDVAATDDALERAAGRAIASEAPFDGAMLAEAVRRAPRDLDEAVAAGDPIAGAVRIADRAQLPLNDVRRALYGPDAVPLAVLARRIGLSRESFAALAQLVGAAPEALPAFDRIVPEEAAKLVREWTRSPAWRAALDRIGAARAC